MTSKPPTQPAGASPDAVAWRLTAVENAVRDSNTELGIFKKEIVDKLDGISSGFATHKDIEVAKAQAKLEHDAIYEKIGDVEKDVLALKKRTWVQNTLSAVAGAILALGIAYIFNDIIH